ncbi:hypothetical protein QYM36_011937 [Artemia franciscana]|uniref:RNA polymerase Rpb7-like N-terminal domain-containing protein n=1 Tax=Artemia franciscana TaxID=6661 RepID=A0AA88HK81_ARTSF|nr:hypothetical protein QYM36_011937 [Artemia franciscana]
MAISYSQNLKLKRADQQCVKMFFHLSLSHDIILHPRYFGPQLIDTVKRRLYSEVEGTCSGKHGFVIAVTSVDGIGAGIIQSGQGFVVYPVKYKAVVFRPFKGQVIDGVVKEVNKEIALQKKLKRC